MSVPFAQTQNALQSDGGRRSQLVIVLAMSILLLWSIWFLFATIPAYETGEIIGIRRDGRLQALFPIDTLNLIRPGQHGYIQMDGSSIQHATGEQLVTVTDVSTTEKNGYVEVILEADYAGRNGTPIALAKDNPLWATVAVEQISPAVLVLRTSGQFIEAPAISLNTDAYSRR